MNKEITFLVQGSAHDPYTVKFINRGNGNISAYCNCQAGINGLYCKHRIGIMRGDPKDVIRGKENIVTVREWLDGSDIEAALDNVDECEKLTKVWEAKYKAALKDFEHNHEAYLEKETPNRKTMIEKARLRVIEAIDNKTVSKAALNHSKKMLAKSMLD